MRRFRTALYFLLILGCALASANLSRAAADDETDTRNKLNFKGVDTYFSATWRAGSGDCAGAWKLVNTQYRLHRDFVKRYAHVDFAARGAYSGTCSGDLMDEQDDESHDACFGCQGASKNWSRLYFYATDWPYQIYGNFAILWVKLKVSVSKPGPSSVIPLGSFCSESSRYGTNPCS